MQGNHYQQGDLEMSGMHISGVPSTSNINGLPKESLTSVHVEVRLIPTSSIRRDVVKKQVQSFIDSHTEFLECEAELEGWSTDSSLMQNVKSIRVEESVSGESIVATKTANLIIHVWKQDPNEELLQFSASDPNAERDGDSDVSAATVSVLPHNDLNGIWDNLIYEDDVKLRLLRYIHTTLQFSELNIDFNVVSWNRVVLLHGPPGTGKTSLCKALAQKLAIRLSGRYTSGNLVEINSHSLFSKWFSESGKLVQRLFAMVTELVEDEDTFVVVLIDEVESLTTARSSSMSSSEPGDALRVVNALLTQLDKLKHRKNCLVMTTSNISESIDPAFVDRADIKQYIGPPPPRAIYSILKSCAAELARVDLIENEELFDFDQANPQRQASESPRSNQLPISNASSKLWDVAHKCGGLSGRALRRLPILAHSRYIGPIGRVPCGVWVDAIGKAVADQKLEGLQVLEGSSV